MNRPSRYYKRIGQPLNLPGSPQCPPGYHWENTPTGPIQGLNGCVKNRVLVLHAPPPAPAPAPRIVPIHLGPAFVPAPPPLPPAAIPNVIPPSVTIGPAAPTTDAAAAPEAVPPPGVVCGPSGWPWWYYAIALGIGAGVGWWAKDNKKTTKRIANAAGARILNRAGDAALARVLG